MRRLLYVIILPLVLACDDITGGPSEPLEDAFVATTAALRFSPASVELVQGGTVTWAFNPVGHTVTFTPQSGAPSSIGLSANTSIARTFASVGNFPYHCEIHPLTMTGTIIVR